MTGSTVHTIHKNIKDKVSKKPMKTQWK